MSRLGFRLKENVPMNYFFPRNQPRSSIVFLRSPVELGFIFFPVTASYIALHHFPCQKVNLLAHYVQKIRKPNTIKVLGFLILVSPRGVEPPTNRLRVCCSAIELRARLRTRIILQVKSLSITGTAIPESDAMGFIQLQGVLHHPAYPCIIEWHELH